MEGRQKEEQRSKEINFFFDANRYNSIFPGKDNPASKANNWLASWRDINGYVQHDILYEAKTNNQAEYGSMLMVLKHIYKEGTEKRLHPNIILIGEDPDPTDPEELEPYDFTIYGDSQLVIYQMIGKYKVKEEDLKPLWLEGLNLVHNLKQIFNVNITFKWVPRNTNNIALNIGKKGYEDKNGTGNNK